VEVAFTDGEGGFPPSSWELPDATIAAFCPDGALALMDQVHGADSLRITAADLDRRPSVDALITSEPSLTLVVRVADCVPVLLAAGDGSMVGAVHVGRLGVQLGVVATAVTELASAGAQDLVAWIGPHICGLCYEVPEKMRAEVCVVAPEAWGETSWGTPSIDLTRAVTAQLVARGVGVLTTGPCTLESTDLASYRRAGDLAGRMAGLIRISA
jgi:hypothetical protein